MLNENAIKAVDASLFSDDFRKPLYHSYCFSNIPQFIQNMLLGTHKKSLPLDVIINNKQQYKKVIVLLVDGFGWNYITLYKEKLPFLRKLINNGTLSKLTSQFPSTTPVELTTINSTLPVAKHGVYEWFYYEPQVDAVIAPLLFSFAGDKIRETLGAKVKPESIFPKQTIYEVLQKKGIPSYVFQSVEYANSPYSQVVFHKAQRVSYKDTSEGFENLEKMLVKEQQKAYYFFYFGKIDSAAHKYGPFSPEVEKEVAAFFLALERFLKKNTAQLQDTLFLFTADHGQIAGDPEKTIYLDKIYPELLTKIKANTAGNLIVPAGSCRDMFLHIKEDAIDEVYASLAKKLAGKALIYTTKKLIEENIFGTTHLSKVLNQRLGNLVILPYAGSKIWWYGDGKFAQDHKGDHGGLTKEEMEIPLLAVSF